MKKYRILLLAAAAIFALTACCKHETAAIRWAAEASCTEDGYTGELYCPECEKVVEQGKTVLALGHETELRNVTEPLW